MYCNIICNWSISLLGECPIPIKQNTPYLLIGKSIFLKNCTIVEEMTDDAIPSRRVIVPSESVLPIPFHQFV